jgi:hypothetical protein
LDEERIRREEQLREEAGLKEEQDMIQDELMEKENMLLKIKQDEKKQSEMNRLLKKYDKLQESNEILEEAYENRGNDMAMYQTLRHDPEINNKIGELNKVTRKLNNIQKQGLTPIAEDPREYSGGRKTRRSKKSRRSMKTNKSKRKKMKSKKSRKYKR